MLKRSYIDCCPSVSQVTLKSKGNCQPQQNTTWTVCIIIGMFLPLQTCVGKLTIIGSNNAWMAPSHYLNQCWNIVNWTLRNNLQWNFNRNSNIFIQENTLENVVCEMAAILSRAQCVKRKRCCHLNEICITGCTGSCQNDNFQCSQWWKFRENDVITRTNCCHIINVVSADDLSVCMEVP